MTLFKRFLVLVIALSLLFVVSCNKKEDTKVIDTLYIYSINDFHGALESSNGEKGAARIAKYILDGVSGKEDQCLIISAGDMFQGSGVSYSTYGKSVLDVMNYVGFDSMTIGNHEFDWNLDTVLQYVDGNQENGEANFPFIACNLIDSNTGTLPTYVKPYTIVEKSGIKIGIIGYLGSDITDSIATNRIYSYQFLDPVQEVTKYTKELRTEMECTVVIAVGHDGNTTLNNRLIALTGDSSIDAIINGHSHSHYSKQVKRVDDSPISYIQSGQSGEYVGLTTITIDPNTKEVVSSVAVNKEMSSSIEEHPVVLQMVEDALLESKPYFDTQLCVAGKAFERVEVANVVAEIMREKYDADFGIINFGGVRESAFPINSGDSITIARIYQLLPFDNAIVTEKLAGSYIKNLYYDSNLNISSIIDKIDDDTLYTVAVCDFLFDKTTYPFQYGTDVVSTGYLIRDAVIDKFEAIGNGGKTWQ